jgi:hypothetical protein
MEWEAGEAISYGLDSQSTGVKGTKYRVVKALVSGSQLVW